jgi:hypothetical protein
MNVVLNMKGLRHLTAAMIAVPAIAVAACSSSVSTPPPIGQDASFGSDSGVDTGADTGAPTGCPSTEHASVSGSINGYTLNAEDAIAFIPGLPLGDFGFVTVYITDFGNACKDGVAKPSSNALEFSYVGGFSTGAPSGKLCIGGQCTTTVTFTHLDSNCMSGDGGSVGSSATGSLTLSCVDGNAVVGTFDIMIGSDHVTGSFDAPVCGTNSNDPMTTCTPTG